MFLGFGARRQYRKRIKVIMALGAALFTFISVRLYYIQLMEGPSLEAAADNQYYHSFYTNNLSFELLDRNGDNLYDYKQKYFAVINPITFYTANEESSFVKMKSVLYILRDYNKDYDISELQSRMDEGDKAYEIDLDTYKRLSEIDGIRGMYLYEYKDYDKKMDWNIKNILSCPVDYKDNTKLKENGCLEREIYDYVKDNKMDTVRFEEDVSSNIISRDIILNNDNRKVVTTLDKKMQDAVQDILSSEEFSQYSQIGAVIMESDSGDILAMAQKDDKISNVNIGVPSGNGFLLGSTFKTIVYEAALDSGIVDEDEVFNVKGIFPDSIEKRGSYTMAQAYTASSNETFAQVGWQVGLDRLYELSKNQGLFEKVLNISEERMGRIDDYGKVDNISIITNSSIGQTVRTTPVAALSIPTAAVNGGLYIKPHIIKRIVDGSGNAVKEYFYDSKRVISEETAVAIKRGMGSVVHDELGTGYNARIDGIETGGKTGTTDYKENNKMCSDGWFAGFFKYDGKYYSAVVFIPQSGETEGESSTAASVFRRIVERTVSDGLL